MISRRNFLTNLSLATIGASLPKIRAEEQIKTKNVLDLKAKEVALQTKILDFYERQSEVFKNKRGYSFELAEKEYIRCLTEIQPELQAFACPKLPAGQNQTAISEYLYQVNQVLAKHSLGLLHVLIRVKDDEFAINTRFFSGTSANVDRQTQLFSKLGLKDLDAVPVLMVEKALTPDVRKTKFWPLKNDALFFGQTITAETGKVEKILIFEEAIKLRAKNDPVLFEAMKTQTIVNELANAFFRQKVPVALWTGKITDKLSVLHLSEAFSDYCSYHVCDGELLIAEASRILTSSNPNYLLSKALTAQAIKEMMLSKNLTTVEDVFTSIRAEGVAGSEEFKKAIIKSYGGNTWINAVANNEFSERYLIIKE